MQDVFLTAAESDTLRKLIAEDPAAADVAQRSIRAFARSACAQPIIIPPPIEQATRRFFDDDTGRELIYDRNEPRQHRSATGRIYRGPAYDRAWADATHASNANDARNTALAAALFDDQPAARHARSILLAYADRYPDYPPIGRIDWSWGKVTASGLEEAVWATSMLWAAEMLAKIGALTDTELAHLHRNLFEPIVELLWGEWPEFHNIRQWVNAAVGCIGLAFNDTLARREAIFGPYGYRQQIGKCYHADGLSAEGSPGYHAYGLTATLILAEAMQRNTFRPYHAERMRAILLAPVRLMQPDGSVPALNDYSRYASFPTRIYATALRRFRDDPAIRAAAGYCFALWRDRQFAPDRGAGVHDQTPAYFGRSQVDWLLAWADIQRGAQPEHLRVEKFSHSGIALVRPAPRDYALLRCSRRSALSHSHYDHLSLIWWHDGQCWLDDAGSGDYGAPLHALWFVQSLAHNTVVVDRTTHERVDAAIRHCSENILEGEVRPYAEKMPDVTMRRTVTFTEHAMDDCFVVECTAQRLIDYALHPAGAVQFPADAESAAYGALNDPEVFHQMQAVGLGYDIPRDVRRMRFGAVRSLYWRCGERILEVDLSRLDDSCDVLLARAPRDPRRQDELSDMLILRQLGWGAAFRVRMRSNRAITPVGRIRQTILLPLGALCDRDTDVSHTALAQHSSIAEPASPAPERPSSAPTPETTNSTPPRSSPTSAHFESR